MNPEQQEENKNSPTPDTHGDEPSFADLFDADKMEQRQELAPGEKITARIVKITEEWIFLDYGEKSEGYLASHELKNEDGVLSRQEGDLINVYFLGAQGHEHLFTTKISGGSTAPQFLTDAYKNGIPIEGLIKKEVKGGYEVLIGDKLRAFCPYSQLPLPDGKLPEDVLENKMTFKIIELSENGKNIILSHRLILEEEKRQQKEKLRDTLQVGMTVTGRITSLKKFGAFIDAGGIEGLIPISEISWSHLEDIHDALSVGQEVEVEILNLDWENDRFSFSLKKVLPDPWDAVETKYKPGSICNGTVTRLVPFGAFIQLEEGVEGLIHISNLGGGRRIKHPREVVAQGDRVEVKVDSVDRNERRIGLIHTVDGITDQEKNESSEAENISFYKKARGEQNNENFKSGTLGDLLKKKLKTKQ